MIQINFTITSSSYIPNTVLNGTVNHLLSGNFALYQIVSKIAMIRPFHYGFCSLKPELRIKSSCKGFITAKPLGYRFD